MFKFGKRSLEKLKGVDPVLVEIMKEALNRTQLDFCVTCGVRTPAEQATLFRMGKSKTLKSKHLSGKAVDVAIYVDSKITWDIFYYIQLSRIVKKIAEEKQINIVWGGDWNNFIDACHFELV